MNLFDTMGQNFRPSMFRRFIGWIRSFGSTLVRGEPVTLPDSYMVASPVNVNGRPVKIAFSHERMMDIGCLNGIDAEAALVHLLQKDIFEATGIWFSVKRIRKAGQDRG